MSLDAKIGAKRLVVGAHYGLGAWLAQRVTAIILALYTLFLALGVVIAPAPLQYADWAQLFLFTVWEFPLGKIFAALALLSLCYHAWVGVRDIWMDYIKPVALRLTLYVLTLIWLAASAFYGLHILWRV